MSPRLSARNPTAIRRCRWPRLVVLLSTTGTLSIEVNDDTPLANNDSDTIARVNGPAVGNVITGVGTIEGTANADSPGADGFGACLDRQRNVPANSDNTADGRASSSRAQFGTLTMQCGRQLQLRPDAGRWRRPGRCLHLHL